MKKTISIILAVLFAIALPVAVTAEDPSTTITLVVEVKEPSYVLSIPESQSIPFESGFHEIGNVTITESSDFAENQGINVTVTSDRLFHRDGGDETIEFMPRGYGHTELGTDSGMSDWPFNEDASPIFFAYDKDGSVANIGKYEEYYVECIEVQLAASAVGKAGIVPGTYTGTITFVAEIVTVD